MQDRKAFGKSLRMLRISRGLTQEAFAPVCAPNYEGALERGEYAPSVEMVSNLATVVDVHPLTLLTTMYVEKDGKSVTELLLQVTNDIDRLSRQLANNVGRDSRDRSELFAELQQWLMLCLAGQRSEDGGTFAASLESEIPQLRSVMTDTLKRFLAARKRTRSKKLRTPATRQWSAKTYRNPYSGELLVVKSRNNGKLKAWLAEYGEEVVNTWLV